MGWGQKHMNTRQKWILGLGSAILLVILGLNLSLLIGRQPATDEPLPTPAQLPVSVQPTPLPPDYAPVVSDKMAIGFTQDSSPAERESYLRQIGARLLGNGNQPDTVIVQVSQPQTMPVSPIVSSIQPMPSAELPPPPVEPAPDSITADPIPNRAVVRFNPNTTEAERNAYLSQSSAQVVEVIPNLNTVIVTLPENTTLPASTLVRATEPDFYLAAQVSIPPSDPDYGKQWALGVIGATGAWASLPTNATPITVAVIDSGICATHPDLVGRALPGKSYVSTDTHDEFGHGCSVAGVIAANIDNDIGIAGIAPNVKILPLKVLNAQGVGSYSDVAAAIVFAADNGARIINLSLGGPSASALLEDAVNYAVNKGVLLIGAAGNTSSAQTLYPAAYAPVVAVGSVDSNLQRSSFSSSTVDLYAPGRDILTTSSDGSTRRVTGTSFAAPVVTGVAALEMAVGRSLRVDGGVVTFGVPAMNPPPAPTLEPQATSLPQLTDKIDPKVVAAVQSNGTARVMVALRQSGSAQSNDLAAQAAAVAAAQAAVLAQVNPGDFVVAQQYSHVAALAGDVNQTALNILNSSPDVERVYLDEPTEIHMLEARQAVNIDSVQTGLGLTGTGMTIAVVDTGITPAGAGIVGNVVNQQCFSSAQTAVNQILSGSRDGSVRRWDVNSGEQLASYAVAGGGSQGASYSPDGKRIAVYSPENFFTSATEIRDVATGALVRRFDAGFFTAVIDAEFSPDGQLIAIGKLDATVDIHNIATGALVRTITVGASGSNAVSSLAWSPNGRELAIAGVNIGISRWNVQTGALIWENGSASKPSTMPVGACDPYADLPPFGTGSASSTVGPNMRVARSTPEATIMCDRRVLVTGGRNGSVSFNTAEIYDPTSNTWTAAAPMSVPRLDHTSTRLANGQVLVTGGFEIGGSYTATVEIYRPSSNTWLPVPNMSIPRVGHEAIRLQDGRVLIVGGYTSGGSELRPTSAEIYDPISNTWSAAGNTTVPHGLISASVLLTNGKVLLLGGDTTESAGFLVMTPIVELYDPITNNWTPVAPMNTPRATHSATLLSDGRVLVVGGSDGAGVLSSAEIYDPNTNAWTVVPAMTTARQYHTATLLADGTVLVAGGANAGTFFRSTELYDPATNSWTNVGDLGNARAGHSAILLGDGRVLFAGGSVSASLVVGLDSTDLFSPGAPSARSTEVGIPTEVAFSRDGKRLLVSYLEDQAILFNAETGTVQSVIALPGDGNAVAFNPDGSRFAIATLSQARLYDATTGAFIRNFPIESTTLEASDVSFSPDGRQLLVGSEDSTLRLWDAQTGAEIKRFVGHSNDVNLVTFNPVPSFTAGCPGGLSAAPNADDPIGHGTNVTRIIAQANGFAPDANVVAIRVFDNGGRGFNSDWVAALNYILSTPSLSVDVVNMSLGSQQLYAPAAAETGCDAVLPVEAQAVNLLTSQGIPVFASSGNNGSRTGISAPACLTNVIAVGATYSHNMGREPDTGNYRQFVGSAFFPECFDTTSSDTTLACFSNINRWVDVLAPGSRLVVDATAGANNYVGTSQASPVAASVGALMLQANPALTAAQVRTIISSSGAPVAVPSIGSFSRVNAFVAVTGAQADPTLNFCAGVSEIPRSECEALRALYNSTNGAGWVNNTGWFTTTTPCSWFNVQCLSGTVWRIFLTNNNLVGALPSELGDLIGLQELYFANNSISGGLPASIGNLINLNRMDISNNQLTGNIPIQIGNMTNLREIYLQENNLSGSIPNEIGSLIQLRELILNRNRLDGSIPTQLGNLTSLIFLNLGDNQLTGTIPIELGSLSNLTSLDLRNNRLSGSIPPQLGSLINLLELTLVGNQLTGAIPPEIGNLVNLFNSLNLGNNLLTGTIPVTFRNLTNLTSLNLGTNRLTGGIPRELGSLARMSFLWLDNNQFTGDIPNELGNLTNLRSLLLQGNQLTGAIPANLGTLPNLQDIDFTNNRLTGNYPSSLTQPSLTEVDIRYNGLTADATTTTFLNARDPDWELFQVQPPTNVTVTSPGSTSATLNWTPIAYTSNPLGYYEYGYREAGSGLPYTYAGRIPLTSSTAQATGLPAGDDLEIVMRTVMPASGSQAQTIISLPSTSASQGLNTSVCATLGVSTIPLTECEALEALYNATNGPAWTNDSGWLSAIDPCTWAGISCTAGRVTTINLGSNNLVGSLPTQIGDLTGLISINLTDNRLTGNIPPQIGNLTSLQTLSMAFNQLTGTIPPEMGSMTSLQFLALNFNQLTGSIPTTFGNLTSLTDLRLDNNTLSGTIPSIWAGLDSLQNLSMFNNQFTGSIPPSLGQMAAINFITLVNNQLQGTIPAELGLASTLTTLRLANNRLTGTIPASLTNLSNLQVLELRNNQFSGALPATLGNLTQLTTLDLGINRLSGSLPNSIGGLNAITNLQINANAFSGALPATFANLSDTLGVVDISQNAITGGNAAVVALLDARQPDWRSTQTVAPANVAVDAASATRESFDLTWTPIAFSSGPGYYEIGCSLVPEGPYVLNGRTSNKTTSRYTVERLFAGVQYFCTVTTVTLPSGFQQNTLVSGFSTEASGRPTQDTPGFPPVITDTGNITITSDITFPTIFEAETEQVSDTPVPLPAPDSECTDPTGSGARFTGSGARFTGSGVRFKGSGVRFTGSGVRFLGVSTEGSNYDTVVSIWADDTRLGDGGDDEFRGLVCNDDGQDPNGSGVRFLEYIVTGQDGELQPPNQSPGIGVSYLEFEVDPNFDYWIVVSGKNGTSGTLKLTLYNLTAPTDPADITNPGIPASELEALIGLYNALGGSSWTNRSGWLETTTPCTWYGVQCNGGHVTGLQLRGNNLVGTIPDSLFNLPFLQTLDLSSNKLTGNLPARLTELTSLASLALEKNALQGIIPPALATLPVSTLDIDYNALRATDPALISRLNTLNPTWDDTQTVPPTDFRATRLAATSARFDWTPILYSSDFGYYQILWSTTSGGPYTAIAAVANPKSTSTATTLNTLPAACPLYLVIRTVSLEHPQQVNILTSDNSPEITLGCDSTTDDPVRADTLFVSQTEGQEATNQGTYETDGFLSLSASVGTVTASGGVWNWRYTPQDGPATLSVTITGTFNGGSSFGTTFTLNVANGFPSAVFTNATGTITAGGSAMLVFSNPADPGPVDVAAGFRYSFDCTGDATYEVVNVLTASFPCVYLTPGTFSARGRITDKDGFGAEYTAQVIVNPAAPTGDSDMGIDLSGPDFAILGDTLTYLITLTNYGPARAEGVQTKIDLPPGLELESFIPAVGSCINTTCTIGGLNPGESATVQMLARTTLADELYIAAQVRSTTADPNLTNRFDQMRTVVRLAGDNLPPDAGDDTAATIQDVPVTISVLLNDMDTDDDPLTVFWVGNPPGGILTINPDQTITFAPDPGFSGTYQFYYKISDGNGGAAAALVTVTVVATVPVVLEEPPLIEAPPTVEESCTPILMPTPLPDEAARAAAVLTEAGIITNKMTVTAEGERCIQGDVTIHDSGVMTVTYAADIAMADVNDTEAVAALVSQVFSLVDAVTDKPAALNGYRLYLLVSHGDEMWLIEASFIDIRGALDAGLSGQALLDALEAG